MGKHVDDLQLVRRMLAGDQEAFDAFGHRYFEAAHRFTASRLGRDRDHALDIVQAAMVKALSNLASYRGEASLLTWLCACCRNEILMHHRRLSRAPVEVELGDEVDDAGSGSAHRSDDPEAALLAKEAALSVHLALDMLPQRQAQALEWMYVERMPVTEIASRLGTQAKAAESLLTRARRAFRASYDSARELRP